MDNESTLGESTPTAQPSEGHERTTTWQSLQDTMRYINEAGKDKTIVVREQDKVSLNLLRLSLVFALIFVITPIISPGMHGLSLVSTVLADLLFASALCWFVARRFGILRSMGPRHALVAFQLMIGAGLLVTVFAINVAAMIIIACMGDRLTNLFS
jgi:hypothetical protein